jgi:hypothetical protein
MVRTVPRLQVRELLPRQRVRLLVAVLQLPARPKLRPLPARWLHPAPRR